MSDCFQHLPSIQIIPRILNQYICCQTDKPIPKIFEQHEIFELDEFISAIFFREYIVELQEFTFNLLTLSVVFDLHMLNPTMNRGVPRKTSCFIIINRIFMCTFVQLIQQLTAKLLVK